MLKCGWFFFCIIARVGWEQNQDELVPPAITCLVLPSVPPTSAVSGNELTWFFQFIVLNLEAFKKQQRSLSAYWMFLLLSAGKETPSLVFQSLLAHYQLTPSFSHLNGGWNQGRKARQSSSICRELLIEQIFQKCCRLEVHNFKKCVNKMAIVLGTSCLISVLIIRSNFNFQGYFQQQYQNQNGFQWFDAVESNSHCVQKMTFRLSYLRSLFMQNIYISWYTQKEATHWDWC